MLKSLPAGDLWGGISAAALVLPQSMAFGMALWLPFTSDASAAALSGLIAAGILSISSALSRGTAGLVAAPTGPTLVLLSGIAATLAMHQLQGEALISAVLLTVALAGLFQVVLAELNLGHWVKYMPYPVVSGFMTGTALLMILSQKSHLLGDNVPLTMAQGGWVPAATALLTMVIIHLMPRWVPRIPGIILGLLIGSLCFHLFLYGRPVPSAWVVGALPGLDAIQLGFHVDSIAALPWPVMLISALALAILASLDTLLTAVVADLSTGSRHSSRRELLGQGAGHLLIALTGGMAGAGTTGASLAAIRSGGRQWAGLVSGIMIFSFIALFGGVAALLPVSVLSGIILYIAIFGMLDRDILLWLRTPRARVDAGVALAVIIVTLWLDLMTAVGLGVALAAIEFIRNQARTSIILYRWDLQDRTSMRRRSHEERQALHEHAQGIVGYVLKGTLFFGTADDLLEQMTHDLGHARYIILDMRRLNQVDLTGVRMIEHMCGMMQARGGELLLTHVPKSMGLVKRKGHRHERMIPYHENVRLHTFRDSDAALEYAEDQLLQQLGFARPEAEFSMPLGESDVLRDFTAEEKKIVQSYFSRRHYAADAYIFHYHDAGDELFVVLSGDIEVLIPGKRKKGVSVARYGPGMAFGEIAFLNPGPRTAEARVVRECEVAILTHRKLKKLCAQYPDIGLRLLMALGHDISRNLRAADARIRRLAEF